MKKKSLGILGLLALSTVALATGCREDLIADGTFRNWCGDKLCNWDTNGKIEKAATWSDADVGVRIVEGSINTRLISGAGCIEFSMTAKVDAEASLQLQLDLNDDGRVDFTYPIPAVDWHEVKVSIAAPDSRAGSRVTIAKLGSRNSVVIIGAARLKVGQNCPGSFGARVDANFLRTNDICSKNTDCLSGVCCRGLCSDCCPDTAYATTCVGEEHCFHACSEGRTCAMATGREPQVPPTIGVPGDYYQSAFLCSSAPRTGKFNDACIDNTDCESGNCTFVREIFTCVAASAAQDSKNGSDVECKEAGDLCPQKLIGTSQCKRTNVIGGECALK